jgi:hypothetical protein
VRDSSPRSRTTFEMSLRITGTYSILVDWATNLRDSYDAPHLIDNSTGRSAPHLKWNTSFWNPWSSAPVAMVTHELFGLAPATPGWGRIRFAPRPPRGIIR